MYPPTQNAVLRHFLHEELLEENEKMKAQRSKFIMKNIYTGDTIVFDSVKQIADEFNYKEGTIYHALYKGRIINGEFKIKSVPIAEYAEEEACEKYGD